MVDVPGGDPACWSHLFEDDELEAGGVVDLNAVRAKAASGVVWSAPPGDLNANLAAVCRLGDDSGSCVADFDSPNATGVNCPSGSARGPSLT